MSEWAVVTLGNVLTRVRRTVSVSDGVTYPAVSVLKEGAGLGPKAPFVGGVTGYETLFQVRAGDVVVRTITAFESPVAVAEERHDATHVSQVFLTYEVESAALPKYLAYLFKSPRFWAEMNNRATGTVLRRKTISDSSFCDIQIALPPVDEQRRIVVVMSAVDAQIEALQVEEAALHRLLQLRREELVNDETVSEVRAELAFDFSTGVRRTPDRAEGPNMTKYLRSANVGYGRLDLSDVLSMNYGDDERAKFGLQFGDVLVSEGSASSKAVGMPAMWRDEIPGPVCFQMTLLRLRAIPGVCIPEFAFEWCMWAYESGRFLDVAGGTSIKHISARRSSQMPVRLPGLDRQQEIATELAAIASHLQGVRTEVDALRTLRADVLDSLLSQQITVDEAVDAFVEVAA